jgi:hypothetical protein
MPIAPLVFVLVHATGPAAPDAEACARCHVNTASVAVHAAHAKIETTCSGCHRAGSPESACVVCHVAGSVAGTETLIRGGRIYLERGCALCHRAMYGLGNPAAFAPPLHAIASRGEAYLAAMLRDPKGIFPSTVMPAAKLDPASERALLVFLSSLRGDYVPPPQPALSKKTCASCHAGASRALTQHRCRFIRDERVELSCARCHAGGVPASERECLYIRQRRNECGVCHEGAIDGE